MNGMTFLETLTGAARAAGETSSASRPILLGTVDAAYTGLPALPRITFDGETTLSGKTYPVLKGYAPVPGDRVALAPVGTTYVIIGAIGGGIADAERVYDRYRTTNQDRTNSATMIDDDTLFFTVAVNSVYRAEWELFYSSDAAADGKVALAFPAGTTCPWGLYSYSGAVGFQAIGFDNPASGTAFTIGGTGSTNTLTCRIVATILTGGTAGDVKLQFAQNTATSGQSMRMRIGSRVTWKRIG